MQRYGTVRLCLTSDQTRLLAAQTGPASVRPSTVQWISRLPELRMDAGELAATAVPSTASAACWPSGPRLPGRGGARAGAGAQTTRRGRPTARRPDVTELASWRAGRVVRAMQQAMLSVMSWFQGVWTVGQVAATAARNSTGGAHAPLCHYAVSTRRRSRSQ